MKAKCLETRLLPNGLKVRRYRRDDSTTYRTIEVPVELWRAVDVYTTRDRIGAWLRANTRRELRGKAQQLRNEGWKVIAIASELQIPDRTVQRWVKHG